MNVSVFLPLLSGMKRASFLQSNVFPCVACLTVAYFLHYIIKGTILRNIKYKKFTLIFTQFCLKKFHSMKNSARYNKCRILITFEFS